MRCSKFHLPRPRYADVAATLALVLAMGGTAYAAATVHTADIADGAVTTSKIAESAVGSKRLAPAAVTHTNVAADAITGDDVDDHSLALRDLLGTNVKVLFSFSLGAHACAGFSVSVPGALVGQVAIVSVVGAVPLPGSVVFGPLKVTSADHVALPACNESGSTANATNVGLRIVTFG